MTKEHLIHLLELEHTILCTFISEKTGDEKKFILKDYYRNLENFLEIHRGDLKNGTFKIVTPAPKLLPVGTKVVVLENCSEKQYIGKELTIISKDSYGYIFSLGNNALKLNFHEVAPIEETEPHKYQEVIDLIEGLPRDKQYVIGRDNLLERIKNLK